MNIFQTVKESVTARQAAEQYGFKVNRNGMITFAADLFHLSPLEAAKKLAEDFQIPVTQETHRKQSRFKNKEIRKRTLYQTEKKVEQWERECVCTLSDYLHLLEEWKVRYAPQSPDDEWANIDEKKRTRLEEALDKRENPPQIYNEDWYEKVKQLLEVLRLEAHSEELPVQLDRIHVNNGTYFLDGRFTEEKDFCLNRLPVNYEGREPEPVKWKRFLSELLETVMWVVSRRWSITVLQGQIWNTGF